MDLIFNDKQTAVSNEMLNSLPQEVRDEFISDINDIPFISNMISPNRKRAKDLPRDEQGRIIVDLTNPHILENVDYFRQAAIHFKRYGCYTNLRPNPNPNSEYFKWATEEIRRCWYGMVRPDDGEWIPGDLYFYWNYCPIQQTRVKKGSRKGDRIIDFPEPWDSTYLWAHYVHQAIYGGPFNNNLGGNHFFVIARRGVGKSYYLASNLAKIFILGESKDVSESVKGTIIAADKTYLIEDGTLNKFERYIDFLAENTEWPAQRLTARLGDMYWEMGYRDNVSPAKQGTGNVIVGLSVKDKPGKVRGKRAVRTYFEEVGSFPNLIDTYNTARYNAEEGDISFGVLGLIGTGGEKGQNFAGALEMIYSPKGYGFYPLPNVFDKAAKGGNVILFLGAYLNRKLHYDENGNSDVIGALIEVLIERYNIKNTSNDPITLTQKKAEMPITIQDCVMKVGGNIYPVADLQTRITELSSDPHAFDDVYVGKLNMVGGKVEFQVTTDTPIHEFPHNDNKHEGALEIFKMPEINKATGEVFRNRYLLGADVYDNDVSETVSLGSVFVLDAFTDSIVAEYTGRPLFANDFYEICRRLCLFYNGKLCYENNWKGLYSYFSQHHCTYLLTQTFSYLQDKDLVKGELFGNVSYGVRATTPIKAYARGLIRDWLLKPKVRVEQHDGENIEITYPQLMDIKNIALLKELSMYNLDNNFDRHDALAMLMLYREDVYRLNEGEPSKRPEYKNEFLTNSFFDTYNQRKHRFDKKKTSIDANGVFIND